MSTKTSIRYFNALAAVCYDHCILDDYDFSFQDMGRNFNLCGKDDLIVILVKSTHPKTFLDVVTDIMPAQFERATALITGMVLSTNCNAIAHEFANSSNREQNDDGSSYPFPYAMNLTCAKDIFTLCIVCAKSERYEDLLDELKDDASHLITAYGPILPVGYIPVNHTENTKADYDELDGDVKGIIEKSSASLYSTAEFESHVHEISNPTTSSADETARSVVFDFSQAVIPDIHTTGYIAPMEDDASYLPLSYYSVDEETSDELDGNAKPRFSLASRLGIADDEDKGDDVVCPNDDSSEVCRIVSAVLTESQVNDITSRQITDIRNGINAVYDISRTPNEDYDPQAKKFDNIHLLFTDLMHDLQKRVIHQEQHDNEFLLFDVANSLEDIRKNYFTDLRNMATLGIYRTIVADTELRAEWFLASITVDNYTDIIRLMFPRQYNGITTGYIKEFFEELLNTPSANELYFALDNGFYKVKFVVVNALNNPTLLARVECNFPVTPHNTDSDES